MKNAWSLVSCLMLVSMTAVVGAQSSPLLSWRYYRLGNTGIQGDYNECLWIAPDGNPWIGGYDPIAEEGGVAKFLQSQNRWQNVSNIDYPVIGTANEPGYCRVSDMVGDSAGNLYMGTWRGLLKMNLSQGPSSLVRFGPENSVLPGGRTRDLSIAPDGSIWISAESVDWAGGGLTQYKPNTNTWTHFESKGGSFIATQAKSTGGYYVWSSGPGYTNDPMQRWDSTTNTWTTFGIASGDPSHLVSLDSVDSAGNTWMRRWIGNQGEEVLDCMRPNGTWASPPLPPIPAPVGIVAFRAFGNYQALLINGNNDLYRFNGTSWTNLGQVPHSGFLDDIDIDSAGNIWICGTGTGGAAKRDVTTGLWQRYRLTNTSQVDWFVNDLSINHATGHVFATANASSSIGGMNEFDGIRWKGYLTDLTYGLGGPWPFWQSPQSEAIYVRPSNGHVVVNPINGFTHEFDGTNWTQIPGGPDQIRKYTEDSLGRLWALPHYGGLGLFESGDMTMQNFDDWGTSIQPDPSRAGTIWAGSGAQVLRTDGNYRFSRSPADFANVGMFFSGMAPLKDGTVWIGTSSPYDPTGTALIKVNPQTGAATIRRKTDANWPFPGDYIYPQVVTPDGRLWCTYTAEYPGTDNGLCFYDGRKVMTFPAPANGAWEWGGLPHGNIADIEVKMIPGGYELWMSCMSRGIAVLTVKNKFLFYR